MKRLLLIFVACCLCLAGCGEKESRYMETANKHYANGEYSEAAYNFIRAIEEDADNEEAYYGLIDAYIMQGEYDKASKYINKALKRFDSEDARELQAELETLLEEEEGKGSDITPTPEPTMTPEPTPEPTEAPTPTQAVKMTPEELYEKCVDSIVWVQAGGGRGSGFFIEEDVVATNYHVVEGATALYIVLPDETQASVLQVLGYSEELDIAILKVDYKGEPLPFNTHGITVGEKTYAIGNPLGYTFTFSDGMVTNKEVVDNNWYLKEAKVFLTNTPISHGNSGGPLLNEYGEVMGLTTAIRTDGQNLNFVVDVIQIDLVDVSKPVSAEEFIRSESGEAEYIYEDSAKSGSPETAQTMIEGEIYFGDLATGEYEDYYKLEITRSGTYYFCFMSENVESVCLCIVDETAEDVLYVFETVEDGEVTEDFVYVDAGTYYVVAVETEEITGQSVGYGFEYELSMDAYELDDDSGDPETAQTVWLSQTLYGTMYEDETENYFKVEIEKAGTYGIYFRVDNPELVSLGIFDGEGQTWAYSLLPEAELGHGAVEMELPAGICYFTAYTEDGAEITEPVEYAFMIFSTEEGSIDDDAGTEPSMEVYGEVQGNTYVNEYLGIRFDIRSDWEYSTAEELQELPENMEDFPVGGSFDAIVAERNDGMVQFDITFKKGTEEDAKQYQNMGEEAYVDYMIGAMESNKEVFEQQGLTLVSVEKECREFCGENKWMVKLETDMSGIAVVQYQIYYMEQEYTANLICSMAAGDTVEEFFELFR